MGKQTLFHIKNNFHAKFRTLLIERLFFVLLIYWIKCIGTVLRDVVISSESLWVIAEALDAIFDIFADSPAADIAASNIGLLPHLEKSVSVLKLRVSLLFLFCIVCFRKNLTCSLE